MNAHLLITSGFVQGQQIPLTAGVTTIGRHAGLSFVFPAEEVHVSSTHAQIEASSGRWILTDLSSSNHTFVNGQRIETRELANGDMIEFGMGGPRAECRLSHRVSDHRPTVETNSGGALTVMLRESLQEVGVHGSRTVVLKEFVNRAYRNAGRRIRLAMVISISVAMVLAGGVWWRAEHNQSVAMEEIDFLEVGLGEERDARIRLTDEVNVVRTNVSELESEFTDLAKAQESLESQLGDLAVRQEQYRQALEEATGFRKQVAEEYADGVAFLLVEFGFSNGRTMLTQGDGTPVVVASSGTGFLIDQDGWIITNRHVAQPWTAISGEAADVIENVTASGYSPVVTRFWAYFPGSSEPRRARTHRVSANADVAVIELLGEPVAAPVLPLAPRAEEVSGGDDLVLIGYPTGVSYMEGSRLDADEFVGVALSQDPLAELNARGLLYPFLAAGQVNDVTSTDLVYDMNTAPGSSGSPILDRSRRVVGVHYQMRSHAGLRTERAVRVEAVWELLPEGVG